MGRPATLRSAAIAALLLGQTWAKPEPLGCIALDTSASDSSDALASNSPDSCADYCGRLGYPYSATSSRSCSCFAEEPRTLARFSDDTCYYSCPGSQTESCGGMDFKSGRPAFSLYLTRGVSTKNGAVAGRSAALSPIDASAADVTFTPTPKVPAGAIVVTPFLTKTSSVEASVASTLTTSTISPAGSLSSSATDSSFTTSTSPSLTTSASSSLTASNSSYFATSASSSPITSASSLFTTSISSSSTASNASSTTPVSPSLTPSPAAPAIAATSASRPTFSNATSPSSSSPTGSPAPTSPSGPPRPASLPHASAAAQQPGTRTVVSYVLETVTSCGAQAVTGPAAPPAPPSGSYADAAHAPQQTGSSYVTPLVPTGYPAAPSSYRPAPTGGAGTGGDPPMPVVAGAGRTTARWSLGVTAAAAAVALVVL